MQESHGVLPIKPPYVSSFFTDLSLMGNCALVSFEAIKAKMIEKGDISKDQIDSKFFVVIGLKVSRIYDKPDKPSSRMIISLIWIS